MRIAFKYLLVLILAASAFAGARAEDAVISVTPGNYQIKRENSSKDDPNVTVNTEEKCIKDKLFDPVAALPQGRGCTATNVKKSGNTVTYDFTCSGGEEMPPLVGKAEYSSNGMAIGWDITVTGQFEGKPVTIVTKAEGKRVGECKQ